MTYKIGDKVKCINTRYRYYGRNDIKVGRIYTVKQVSSMALELHECKGSTWTKGQFIKYNSNVEEENDL